MSPPSDPTRLLRRMVMALSLLLLLSLGVLGLLLAYWSEMRDTMQRMDAALSEAARRHAELSRRLEETRRQLEARMAERPPGPATTEAPSASTRPIAP